MGIDNWPANFPDTQEMMELLQRTSKASWRNENEFTNDHVMSWLENFHGLVYDKGTEQRLALWLLCNYTYYNEGEIRHLCYDVFRQFLHALVAYYGTVTPKGSESIFDKVCFAAMGNPGESGGLLLYYFRQQSRLGISKFYYPTAFPDDDEKIIVFIDDATLSGETAKNFFSKNLRSINFKRAFFLSLFASEEAVNTIQECGITVIASTRLSEREKCFSEQSLVFSLFPDLRTIAEEMVKKYGMLLYPKHPLGFNDGQYCFGMWYNTPNNTLPIFWSNRDWYPVFPRKEKRNNVWRPDRFEEYV